MCRYAVLFLRFDECGHTHNRTVWDMSNYVKAERDRSSLRGHYGSQDRGIDARLWKLETEEAVSRLRRQYRQMVG